MLDALPKNKLDATSNRTDITATQPPDNQQLKIAAAAADIDASLRAMKGLEKAQVSYIPEKGTNISLPSPQGNGETFTANVVDIRRNGDQVEIVIKAGSDYPGEPNKQFIIPAAEFETQFKQQIENNARYEAVMDTIAQTLLQPALASTKTIDAKSRATILAQATELLMRSEQDDHLISTANELNSAIDEHNQAIEKDDAKFQTVMNNIASEILDGALADNKTIDAAQLATLEKAAIKKLTDAKLDSYTDEVKADIAELVTAHNEALSQVGAKKPVEDARAQRQAALETLMATHPELEARIGVLDQQVRALLTSKEWANDSQLDPVIQITNPNSPVAAYLKILDQAQDLPGMTPAILEALKNKWGKEINRQAELAPALIKLENIVQSYLAQTDTVIDTKALNTIAIAITAVPNLSQKQKDILLANASKKIAAHNNAISTRTVSTPPLPSSARNIKVQQEDGETTPRAVSAPDFNQKIDDLDAAASKLLQSMSSNVTSNVIDLQVLTNLLEQELKKQNIKIDSKEAQAWLENQTETAKQINQGIESLNQAEEKVRETIANCHQEIDTLIDSPDISTLEERAALQETIDTLAAGPEKTEIQARLTEIRDHDQAILQADALLEKALADGAEIDAITFQIDLQVVLPPQAKDAYWKIAQEIIEEHNRNVVKVNLPEDSKEDIAKNDKIVSELNDQVTELLISGDHVSIKEIADLQLKINSITDEETKTALQKHIIEIETYNQALTQADTLLEDALASKKMINATEIQNSISKLIPTASERYWAAAEEIINEHNARFGNADNNASTQVPEDQNIVTDTQKNDPTTTVTTTPDPAPQADVLAAPQATTTAAPTDVLNKVDVTPLSPDQIAKRDQMFDLIEKNLILNEQEKGRIMAKVMDLVRTSTRNTNVIDELQKVVTDNGMHQESQRQLKEEGPIFAAVIQSAVQSTLNTNDLDYKKNEADYQKMLSELPTDAARTAMKAVYEEAISNKKLRESSKAIQAKVDEVLANQANFVDKRAASLDPLFQRMNVIIKTNLPRESQVLGSQTITPDVSQWEAPISEEKAESLQAKAKRSLLELVNRVRGKKIEAEETPVDTANDLNEAFVRTPAEMVDFLVESNKDLTTEEKNTLRKSAVEQLEKGTDISKTVENLKAALADRARVNREIAAVVLNAPELSKQMYFALAAARNNDLSAEKRTAALVQWQSFVDQLPTDRAKAAVKKVYQDAMKDKNLGADVNAIEERLMNQLADNSSIHDREQALTDLVNSLGKEINQAIQNRKPEVVIDQAANVAQSVVNTASEVLATGPQTNVENIDTQLDDQLNTKINSVNLIAEKDQRDILPKEFFASDMDQLISTMENEKNPALIEELKAIRKDLVDSDPNSKMGKEALARLEKALKTKYPQVLATMKDYIENFIDDHNNRVDMQAEIKTKTAELFAKVDTLTSADISQVINELHQKFTTKTNRFAVDQALVPLNDGLREQMHTIQAVKDISQLWQTEPSLALDKVANILNNNQLDQTIMTRLVAFAKNMAPVMNAATTEKRQISANERGKIIFELIPYMSIPQDLKTALVTKVNKMLDGFNSQLGPDNQANAA